MGLRGSGPRRGTWPGVLADTTPLPFQLPCPDLPPRSWLQVQPPGGPWVPSVGGGGGAVLSAAWCPVRSASPHLGPLPGAAARAALLTHSQRARPTLQGQPRGPRSEAGLAKPAQVPVKGPWGPRVGLPPRPLWGSGAPSGPLGAGCWVGTGSPTPVPMLPWSPCPHLGATTCWRAHSRSFLNTKLLQQRVPLQGQSPLGREGGSSVQTLEGGLPTAAGPPNKEPHVAGAAGAAPPWPLLSAPR